MKEERSLQGTQGYITSPSIWRKHHGVDKRNKITCYYTPNSVLVVNPDTKELSELEEALIELLISLPQHDVAVETVDKLKTIVKQFEA